MSLSKGKWAKLQFEQDIRKLGLACLNVIGIRKRASTRRTPASLSKRTIHHSLTEACLVAVLGFSRAMAPVPRHKKYLDANANFHSRGPC